MKNTRTTYWLAEWQTDWLIDWLTNWPTNQLTKDNNSVLLIAVMYGNNNAF
jgi:hypothetical protein